MHSPGSIHFFAAVAAGAWFSRRYHRCVLTGFSWGLWYFGIIQRPALELLSERTLVLLGRTVAIGATFSVFFTLVCIGLLHVLLMGLSCALSTALTTATAIDRTQRPPALLVHRWGPYCLRRRCRPASRESTSGPTTQHFPLRLQCQGLCAHSWQALSLQRLRRALRLDGS